MRTSEQSTSGLQSQECVNLLTLMFRPGEGAVAKWFLCIVARSQAVAIQKAAAEPFGSTRGVRRVLVMEATELCPSSSPTNDYRALVRLDDRLPLISD